MATNYPNALDTTTQLPNNRQDDTDSKSGSDLGLTTTTGAHATDHNNLADAMIAVQTEMGVNPSGIYADIATRLDQRDLKDSCIAASTANVAGTYSNGTSGVGATKAVGGTSFVLDGVTCANGNRVFLKDQTNGFENGIYTVSGVGSSIVLTRATDADTATKLSDTLIASAEQGTVNADSIWELTTNNPITVGTTNLAFRRIDANNIARSQLGTDAKGWVFLGHAEVTGSSAARTPDVSWTASYAQLMVEHYVSGYAGGAVARIVPGLGGTAPNETNTAANCAMIENVTLNTSSVSISGWPTAVTVSNVARYGMMWVVNIATQVKRMSGLGQYGGTAPTAVPTCMTEHGMYNDTTNSIRAFRMTSYTGPTGNSIGSNLSVGSYINVWGRNND